MTRLTRNFESQGLSIPRIGRLLRPLRSKCIVLATMHPAACDKHPSSTYGSKTRSIEFHPLDILPPPDNVRSYHVDHRSVASLRAAIYAVRDCFREIVVKTKTTEALGSVQRVPRLADLCSIVVGEHMQVDEDFEADTEEDSEQIAEIERLYEVIPVQYRRSALLAHALDIALRCPHHFTLLSILLDVSLLHDLYHESRVLLHLLLQASVAPAAGMGSALRLCHSAHSNYLVDLSQKWNGAGRPTSVFIRILTETLVAAARPELWRCKALRRFTRELHNQDFHSFMDMAGRLAGSIGRVQMADPPEDPIYTYGMRKLRTEETSLLDQLSKWLNYSSPFSHSHSQELPSILEFLERCRQSGVHKNTDSLAATLVCWATHYLSVVTPSVDSHSSISRLLEDISPTVTIFNLLIEKSFGVNQSSIGRLQGGRVILQTYASSLRAKNLLLLEASLWACTLRFVETSVEIMGRCAAQKEVGYYREELMDLVEDAEHRCFGSGLRCVRSAPGPQAAEGWRWEEFPGCWVQCHLPASKKAKRHHEDRQRCSRVVTKPPSAPSAPTALHNVNRAVDNEDYRGLSSSFELSFKSIVSSALSNRTRLHGYSTQTSTPTLLPRHNYTSDVPASDDALNLFAYADFSPVSCIN
ncbi:hypothetical protein DFH09DRAFT_534123 [Mycena vulgaris]|nr:hypothetical protein DFH09DRAFT_534123 [Mycena vulgaris]